MTKFVEDVFCSGSDLTQTWWHGHSESCATAWHTFDLADDTNMLMDEGITKYP